MYSQYEEERYILAALDGTPVSRLLDIGAWNAQTFSNSRALIEAGWEAVLFEPSPGPCAGLVEAYRDSWPRVRVCSAAVSVEGHMIPMEITHDAVSMPSADAARVEQWAPSANFYGRLMVPSITLERVFNQFGERVEMVSFDVEGQSVDLFEAMVRLGPRPRCIVVEHDSRFVECSQIAEASNYTLLHENGTNRVYRWDGVREW